MAFRLKNVLTLNTMANSWWGKAKMALEYALFRSGPLSMAPSQLGAVMTSDESQASANIEFHVQPLSLDKFGDPLHDFPPSPPACAISARLPVVTSGSSRQTRRHIRPSP